MVELEQLEHDALSLSVREREKLVLAMWDSLDGVSAIDPEGVSIALDRDADIEAGSVKTISHAEFHRRTRSGQ